MFKECQRPKSDKNKQKSGADKKRSARHEVLVYSITFGVLVKLHCTPALLVLCIFPVMSFAVFLHSTVDSGDYEEPPDG